MAETTQSQGNDAPSPDAMRGYSVLARKYRPRNFDDLIGQEVMVRTLRNAFASGRIAQAYMLTGVRGVGKTTTARILARALNYEREGVDGPTIDLGEPGIHCQAIMESRHQDVLEIDAASHTGIDNIREIIDGVRYRPSLARTKVYIIDEVHMLSKPAFNALLKTLEEPPEHVKFIFATTEIRKVPVTVLSRCQRFDLRRVEVEELRTHFGKIAGLEQVEVDEDALTLIARAAEGSVRDGLSLLDQAIAHGEGRITGEQVRAMLGLADRGRIFDLLETVLGGDPKAALEGLRGLHQDGAEPAQILTDLGEAVHVVTRMVAAGPDAADPTLAQAERERATALSEKLDMPALARAWQMLLKGLSEVQTAPRPLTAAEMVLLRMCYLSTGPSPDELARKLEEGGNTASAPAPAAAAPAAPPPLSGAPASNGGAPQSRSLPPRQGGPGGQATALARLPQADPYDAPDPQATPEGVPMPATFEEVVALLEERRELMLYRAVAEGVRLVSYAPPSIEINLAPGAASTLANELREFLRKETGKTWMVLLSEQPGAPTIAQIRAEREAKVAAARAAELEDLMNHPAIREALAHFPGAKIAEVRPLEARAPETGDEPLDDDDDEDGSEDERL